MPVRQISPIINKDQAALIDALAAEWEHPTSDPNAPTILEQTQAIGPALHIYVVWEAWNHLDRAARHELVMDAAERVKSLDDLMKITQAWALLPDEADKLKLPWR